MGKFNHKQKFTKKEDIQLIRLVKKHGVSNWEEVSSHMHRRSARQCRDRYNNYLSDDFKKGDWTENEDQLIISLYQKIGPHWLTISKSLPGRSGNDIKNRWHKKLLKNIKYDDNNSIITDKIQTDKTETKPNNNTEKDDAHNEKEKNNNDQNNDNSDNVIEIFNFYESAGKQWNLFPNEEEKKSLFDI